MILFTKFIIGFVTALTYPPTSDARDTFGMDIVCFMESDCEITITTQYTKSKPHGSGTGKGNSKGRGWSDGYGAKRQACEEDMPCWNCATMGNRKCGKDKP